MSKSLILKIGAVAVLTAGLAACGGGGGSASGGGGGGGGSNPPALFLAVSSFGGNFAAAFNASPDGPPVAAASANLQPSVTGLPVDF